ncbi:MAG: alpha/beta hydrolase [Pseudomonadota bacterium]
MKNRRSLALPILTVSCILAAGAFLATYRSELPLADLVRKYTNENSQFVDVLGMRVHYRFEGSGEQVLLLLHGIGASLHTWDGWIQPLENDVRILRVDMPGFGLTGPAPDGDYSVQNYVAFIDRFLDTIGVQVVDIAGNSLGGQVAWNYALRHPARVRRLVLIDAAGYPREDDRSSASILQLARLPGVRDLLTVLTPRSLIADSLAEVYGDPSRLSDETVDRYFELARRPGNRRAFVERAAASAADENGDHRLLRLPVLILWGAEDRWIPLAHGRGFKDDIEDSRLIVYPGVGHLPMEELPGPTARAALTFLRP